MIVIVCIIHSLAIGGMERVMSLLINNFANRPNVQVHLILIGRKRNIEFELDKRINIHKPQFKFNPRTRNWSTFKTLLFIRHTVEKIHPTTILSFGEMWNNLVLLSLIKTEFPIYISDRSQPNKDLGKLHNKLRNWLYPKAAGFVAQTSIAKDIATKNNWNNNITVIGNPIRTLNLSNVPKENIILTVGRLIPSKNIDQLIRIFASIDAPNWQLVVIGGNAKKMDLLTRYRQLIKELKLEDRVLLVGEQKNIESYMAKSSIFAFTSTSEGFPNALAEAIAARLPVIAYDCVAGPSDLIENNRNGFLIEENNEALFQEGLKKLINSEAMRNNFSYASEKIFKRYKVNLIAQRFYNKLLQNHENTY